MPFKHVQRVFCTQKQFEERSCTLPSLITPRAKHSWYEDHSTPTSIVRLSGDQLQRSGPQPGLTSACC